MNFVVDREGKITNIKVIKGIGFGCDEESIRVLGKMPLWAQENSGDKQFWSVLRCQYGLY